jgi:hypothetical protein
MSLPPIYESFRKSGIRFITNSPNGKFNTNCPECKKPNTNFVELDANGLGFRCHCDNCGFSGFERLRRPQASGNGPSPLGDDDAKRKAFEEARREFDPEPEPEAEQNLEEAFAKARKEFPEDDEDEPTTATAPEPEGKPEAEPPKPEPEPEP